MNRKNMENETIKERFLGTIFGQAVGDALGLSTEFMSKQEVDRFYPNGICLLYTSDAADEILPV